MSDTAYLEISYKNELIDHATDAIGDAKQARDALAAIIRQKYNETQRSGPSGMRGPTPRALVGMQSTLGMQTHTVESWRNRAFDPDVSFRTLARLTKEFLLLEEMTAAARWMITPEESSA